MEASIEKCWNWLEAPESCADCACCDPDPLVKYKARVAVLERALEREKKFDAWHREPAARAQQLKVHNANLRYLRAGLTRYRKRIDDYQQRYTEKMLNISDFSRKYGINKTLVYRATRRVPGKMPRTEHMIPEATFKKAVQDEITAKINYHREIISRMKECLKKLEETK